MERSTLVAGFANGLWVVDTALIMYRPDWRQAHGDRFALCRVTARPAGELQRQSWP